MAIPNLAPFFEMHATKDKKKLSDDLHLFLDHNFQSLNKVVDQHNDGLEFPGYTQAEILAFDDDTYPVGTMWYDTAGKLVIKTGTGPAAYKQCSLASYP